MKQYVQLLGRGLVGVRASDGKFLWGYNRVANNVANISTPIVKRQLRLRLHRLPDGRGPARAVRRTATASPRRRGLLPRPPSTFQNHHGGIVLVGDHIYAGHGHNKGFPICVDFVDAARWPGAATSATRAPGSAAVTYADGRLYFRYQNGVVVLVEATPDGLPGEGVVHHPRREEARAGPTWSSPTGACTCASRTALYAYDVRKP